mmetsp:Transcript_23562/g.25987  ORF Transcript_23562/g.25987 Transcript_23562/m.25987 type:complete len:503 (+) Transcript_23562:74-1582(+)
MTFDDVPIEQNGDDDQNNKNDETQKQGEIKENWYDTAAGVMGNVLEWYDFALFGFFSDIIADVFFPPSTSGNVEDDKNANLIKTFCIFGGAFLMRPLGGLMIGYIGDKHGRKAALTKSLFLMAIPTTLMGCLPSYETAGILSPILLTFCRLLQGMSVGGQLPASLVYTAEKHPRSQWGYYGSLPMMAANIGTLLGNLCAATLRQTLSEEQLISWGWRLPFFSGILIAFVACYLKRYGVEIQADAGENGEGGSIHANPIKYALRKGNRLAILEAALTPMLWASGFYVSFVWMAVFMDELLDPPIPNAFWINTCAMLLSMTCLLPYAGHLSDKYGRVFLMTISCVSLLALGPFIIIIISKSNGFIAFLCQCALGVMLSFFGGPLCAWLIENFPADIRLTSVSIGYDLAHAIVGGFSPALATALFEHVGPYAPGLIYFVFGTISLCGIYITYFFGGDQREDVTGDVELEGGAKTNDNKKQQQNGNNNNDPLTSVDGENSSLPEIA